MPDLAEINSKELIEWLTKAIKNPPKIQPIYVTGPPGVGKSAVIRKAAELCKVGFIDIRPAQRDPTDVRGIPAVLRLPCKYCGGTGKLESKLMCPVCAGEGKLDMAKWLPAPELPLDPDWMGFISLEELSSAPPLTQAAYYQLVLDRQVGEYYLPKGAYLVATGNRLKDRAVVSKMSTALANRFTHFTFVPRLDNWLEWARANDIHNDVIDFIVFRPELLSVEYDDKTSEMAYPTPRSWEFVSNAIKMSLSSDFERKAIEGSVGRGASGEFSAFVRLKNELPNVDEILNGKDYVPQTIDIKRALVSALVSKAASKQHFERLITFSDKLGPELAVILVKMLLAKDSNLLKTCPSTSAWLFKHNDLIISRK